MLAYGPIPFWKDGRGLSAHRGVHSFLQPSNPPPALLSLRAADLGSQLPRYSMCLLSFLLPIPVLVAQRVRLFTTSWTVDRQAPLSIGFLRQEYWSVLPFPSPGDLLYPGTEPRSPAPASDALLSALLGQTQKSCGFLVYVKEISPIRHESISQTTSRNSVKSPR